jgi:hypothetical protein
MFLNNYFVEFKSNFEVYSIPSYTKIINNFINKYIEKICENDYNEENVKNAIIYSKYYLYYKTFNCIYDKEVMDILYLCDIYD